MKFKTLITVFVSVTVAFSICTQAFAANTDEYSVDWLEESGANELAEYLSSETLGYLKRLGCEEISFDKILTVSIKDIFSLLKEIILGGIKTPLKGAAGACGSVILFCICSAFFPDDDKNAFVLNIICGCFLIVTVFIPAFSAVKGAVGAIKAVAGFQKALIPVTAVLLTASGSPVSAVSLQGAAVAVAQATELFAAEGAFPLICLSGALGMAGALFPEFRISAISDFIRKTVTTVLASVSGLFAGFLTLKSVLSSSSDSVAFRGLRFAANALVPVVGGALSESYSSVVASVSLLKTTVGIYGIIAVCATVIPVVINLALWAIAMRAAGALSEFLNARTCADILKNIGFFFTMTNTMLILVCVIFVISSGLVAAIKSGA